ncbi:MAG: hypothetical protein US68_C0002G0039 [Candidatus Shapirobacteria bacterium GW2011_GWE1_38_10]|uniref:Uncharacterized protein n=1 Tax=Candidatus Shapirobacteria bacterium GW2011_GWE1_38_10 TaxID=1618488 RepID=A0A0G0I8B5_9BACT|nr:MAG: hypothetical protein US46_C0003G0031 [Candidatus Shapirobacteria bacterium GW2011_GWF2_37_20]KKQ50762.1 MAG: hypothetical protein US68_C0002G0039 [Candidatus Shapirobacteria bacterium GW2011_GWE1_38_10]KKQ64513.1 MAG: hypothetical protein US85_C0008G0042 [Candidatus Shapirobacteria bacterium GW2011_GWF1_38_23]HBP51237.1 hypothetical protein [Candidatus Shapirobacteria bacterium]
MKKNLLIICLDLFLIVFLLVILPSIAIKKRQGTSHDTGNQQIAFVKENPITFSFVSNKANLQSLSIDMKNPRVTNNSKINFEITSPNSKRNIVFYGNNAGDPSSVPLKFSPFSDPAFTKYSVYLSTDNTDPESIYLITDQDSQPVFRSYYLQSDLKTNLRANAQRQLELIGQRNQIFNVIYLLLIFLLNYLVLVL